MKSSISVCSLSLGPMCLDGKSALFWNSLCTDEAALLLLRTKGMAFHSLGTIIAAPALYMMTRSDTMLLSAHASASCPT
ncbi:Hypothetical predicted protein [Cloeon dipterum]|uniref:Uncharacterized protein n=1 Tax=Cloeon dipterum TaxID=197152 RepID=A0A8S1C7Y0_9INSE|nr:Hypothetical predicted protein [Cloeon dipterum]